MTAPKPEAPIEQNLCSTKHVHEPLIPPSIDDDGRCRICQMLVEIGELCAERDAFKGGLAIVDKQRAAAESKLARMEALMREPSEEMARVGATFLRSVNETDIFSVADGAFKAMSAALLAKVEGRE